MPIILIIFLFLFTSCDTDKLNQRSAKINSALANATKSITGFDFGSKKGIGSSSQFSNKVTNRAGNTNRSNNQNSLVKKAGELGLESLKRVDLEKLGLGEVNRTFKETQESIQETKKQYDSTKADLKRSARQIANKIPRSEREANQFVRSHTKDFVEFIRARLKDSSFRQGSTLRTNGATSRRDNQGRKR